MMGMLKYSPGQAAIEGLSMSWLPDKDYDADHKNGSMTLRSTFKGCYFNIPLKHTFGFIEDNNKIVYGVKQGSRLKRVINEEYLQVKSEQDKTNFKCALDKVSLYMAIVKPSLAEENKLYKSIKNKNVVDILFRGRFTQTYTLLEGSNRLDWSFQNTTRKPRYLIIGFKKKKRYIVKQTLVT